MYGLPFIRNNKKSRLNFTIQTALIFFPVNDMSQNSNQLIEDLKLLANIRATKKQPFFYKTINIFYDK
ncbi:hypothetical protein COR50_20180 [Chitinophaga caeni]|uniref:Uncharacterized protein n=1 Tax=Chitinophaga caeni TaxID=2029983 RepID=A0A291QZ91_9BACT|nr:hypothetical protein COR50_20180 [Chitinophaga caeni]